MKKNKVTICIGTIGSPTFEKCKNLIYKHYSDHPNVDKIVVIKNKTPQSAWLNEMRAACADTEWCLQVDEDMYLTKLSLDSLISLYRERESQGIEILNASSLLYDLFLEKNIGSLKLWSSKALQDLEFRDKLGGDRDFAKRAANLGYRNVENKMVLGQHDSAPSPAIAFAKYYEYTQKIMKFESISSAKKFVKRLELKWKRDGSFISKKAYNGASKAIKKPINDRSKRGAISKKTVEAPLSKGGGVSGVGAKENMARLPTQGDGISLNDTFSKIYCINLKRHSVRKKRMSNMFGEIGVSNVSFFSAHDCLERNVKFKFKTLAKSSILRKKNRPGALGCLMSHISVIKNALKNNYESILILEDDIIPIENINRRLLKIRMPRDWKIMYFGTNMADLWENSTKLNDDFYKSKKVNGTFAYALHKSAFREVLAILETFDGPVDWLLHRYMEKVGGALCLRTPVFAPLLFESEIGKYFRGNVLSFYNKMKIDISQYSISSVMGEKDGLFIGLGTGRCGTQSLAHLFDSQPNFTVYHEKNDIAPMPTWKFDLQLIKLKILELCCSSESRVVGDVGMYYLPYIEWLSSNVDSLKVISLKRDMDKTVASYDRKLSGPGPNGRNHFSDHDGSFWNADAKWDPQYPKYNDIKAQSRIPYLERYYAEYYKETDRLGIKTFDTEDLNDRDMVSMMLDHVGVDEKNIIHPKKNRMLSK